MSKHGTKHTCWSCGTKFYDLNRPEPKCPKCGADPKEAPVTTLPEVVEEEEDVGLDDFDEDFGGAGEEE